MALFLRLSLFSQICNRNITYIDKIDCPLFAKIETYLIGRTYVIINIDRSRKGEERWH